MVSFLGENIGELDERSTVAAFFHGAAGGFFCRIGLLGGDEESGYVLKTALGLLIAEAGCRRVFVEHLAGVFQPLAFYQIGGQLEDDLRLVRIPGHAGAEDALDDLIQCLLPCEREDLLLHLQGAALGVQHLTQPGHGHLWLARPEVRQATQLDQGGKICAVVFQPRIHQLSRLLPLVMIQQRGHQLPAVVGGVWEGGNKLPQPAEVLIGIHRQVGKAGHVRQGFFLGGADCGFLCEGRLEQVQMAKALMQPDEAHKELGVAPVFEVEHGQPLAQGLRGWFKMVGLFFDSRQILEGIQALLRVRGLGQLLIESERPFQESSAQQTLCHLPHEGRVLRLQLGRLFPDFGRLFGFVQCQSQASLFQEQGDALDVVLREEGGEALNEVQGNLGVARLGRQIGPGTEDERILGLFLEHLVVQGGSLCIVTCLAQQVGVDQRDVRVGLGLGLGGDVFQQKTGGVVLAIEIPKQVQHPAVLRLFHQEIQVLARQTGVLLRPGCSRGGVCRRGQ